MNDSDIYFLDTNAASAFGRKRNLRLVELMHRHKSQLRLSSVVWAELEYGAYKREDEPVFRERLTRLREHIADIEPFDEHAATWAAKVRAYLEGRGEKIGDMDCLIAGHALAVDAVVVTHNVDEFERVPNLKVVDWEQP